MTIAQASSVQREPSMEEILASIRRIIEDSDNVRKPQDGPAPRGIEQAAPLPRAEVETFRAELGPAAETGADRRPTLAAAGSSSGPALSPLRDGGPAQVTELGPKAFRLAEVQAQVARETAAQPKAPEAGRKPVTLTDVQREIAREQAAPARPAATVPSPQPQQARPEAAWASGPQTPMQSKIEPLAPQVVVQKPAEPVVLDVKRSEPAPKANVAAASLEAVAKPIISQAAGRQVAAAFGQLSEAFAQRANKTFDEMAEQMLRPMLQEWLDNNLPVLVERLVREEIERVARGV